MKKMIIQGLFAGVFLSVCHTEGKARSISKNEVFQVMKIRHTEPLQKGEVSQEYQNFQSNTKEIFRFAQYDNVDLSLRESKANKEIRESQMNLEPTNEKVECVDCHESASLRFADSRNDKTSKSHATNGESIKSYNDKVSESLNAKIGESSGIILGFGLNYNNARFTQNYEQIVSEIKAVAGATGADAREMTTTITQLEPPTNTKGNGGGYSLLFGYAGFLEPFSNVAQLGMRSFVDLSASHIDFASNDKELKSTLLRYGLNVDLLLNFIVPNSYVNVDKTQKYYKLTKSAQKATKTRQIKKQKSSLIFGIFAGVRIGGVSYFGNDTKAINKRLNTLNNGSFPKSSFDFALNVGLRANIANNNGVELAFALPVYQMNYKASDETVINDKTTTMRLSGEFRQNWSVGVRYIYTFDRIK